MHEQLTRIEKILRQHPGVRQAAILEDGAQLVAHVVPSGDEARPLQFSLFYFADARADGPDKYRLYLEGAQFADAHNFKAVWTPERHFHANGGLYPNPSVLSAALAVLTQRVRLRAGSVALPLHNPFRAAEEWSVVDNLSRGRVDLAFTSGWIPNDFAAAPTPDIFLRKREVMLHNIDVMQRLWRGETIATRDGNGVEVDLGIFPRPIQSQLPIWLTCSGDPRSFELAGERGWHVLTALLTMPLEEAAAKSQLYRQARAQRGLPPDQGHVSLMLHTFVGADADEVAATVRGPLTEYLASHVDLMRSMAVSLKLDLGEIDVNNPKFKYYLASFAFERYYQMGSLIGTPEKCLTMVNRLKGMQFDEVACLIDFGVDDQTALDNLSHLAQLKALSDSTVVDLPHLNQWLRTQSLEASLGAVYQHAQLPMTAAGEVDHAALQSGSTSSPGGELVEPLLTPSAPQTFTDRVQQQLGAHARQKQQMQRIRKQP